MKKKSYRNALRVVASRSHARSLKQVSQPFSSGHKMTTPTHPCPSLVEHPPPIPLLPLIGRKQETATICMLLQQPEVRLLTLTGPGGVGKTRLALQVAAEVSSTFPDGILFVSLIPICTASLLLPTIAQALGLAERQGQSALTLLQAAVQDKCMLLLLDNFEQIATAAPQLKDLLAVCPQLKILVTSRIILGLLEEQ